MLSDKGAITTKTKENVMFIVAGYDKEARINMFFNQMGKIFLI